MENLIKTSLYPFQLVGVEYLVKNLRGILNWEMGTGKTAAAITAMKALNVKKALIVTPAIVRTAWLSELDRWWPGHPEARPILYGKSRGGLSKKQRAARDEAYASPIRVVSYALVGEVVKHGPMDFDCVVFDEAHRLKNPKAAQSKVCREILDLCPGVAAFALTGTLMPDQPKDVWNILDLLWPGRFGKMYKFYSRYAEQETITGDNGEVYGTNWYGVNRFHVDELKERLSQIASRVTKAEVAHLLPPFCVSMLKIEGEQNEEKAITFKDWQEAQEHLDSYGTRKIPSVVEWAKDAAESASHLCILTHRRETARAIAREIEKAYGTGDVRISTITGDTSPEERNEELAHCRQADRAVVVATMHSVGIGIDLTFCTQALFAELYYRPETVIQAIGRFSRLSGKVPSSVQLMCLQGTIDEIMAQQLLDKIAAINQTMKSGLSEEKLQEALSSSDGSIAALNSAISAYGESAYD